MLRSTKKLKKKFNRSKSQCSTPLQSSTFNTHQNKLNNRKKSKIQKKLVNVFDAQLSSNNYKKSNLQLNSSSSIGINDRWNQFEQSIQIAGSRGLPSSNKQKSKKYTYALNSIVNNGKKNRKVVLNKSKRHCIKKKKSSSKEKHSDWYQKVMDIIGIKKNYSFNNLHNKDHKNEEIKTDKSLENHCSKSATPLKSMNNKPLEQQILSTSSSPKLNNKSFQLLKHIEDIEDINEVINKSQQSYELHDDDDTSDSYCNSLYDTYYEVNENKIIESIRSSSDVCTSDSIVSDEPFYGKIKTIDNKSPQQNTSPLNSINISCNLNLNCSIDSCADSLDIKLVNILERCEVPNVDHKFNNQQSVCSESNSKSFILQDVMNRFSDISIKNEITNHDHSLDKSIPNILSNSSALQSSYFSEQDTVIYKQNCTNDLSIENPSNSNWFFDESVPLITPSKHSSKENSLKNDIMYDSISLSKSKDITSDFILNDHIQKTQIQENSLIDISPIKYEQNTTIEDWTNTSCNSFNDLKEINTMNAFRRKRYGTRFQNNFNVIEESFDENEIEIKNSTQKYIDLSQSTQYQQNIQGFRLEPGKKWRRSIIIVRNFIDGNLDQTVNFSQNITRGRKWISTVDEVLRQQAIDTTIHQRLNQNNNFRNSINNTSQQFAKRNSTDLQNEIAREYIFNICNQQYPISFESWLKPKKRKKWGKVGEGVFGEVFSYSDKKSNTVVKIIPIEGKDYINSEKQKMFYEVYTEILIASELNKLFNKNGWNQSDSFCRLKNISCVQGKYPTHLIDLWEQYNNEKGSDNDNPHILPDNQVYIVLEMVNGGIDVESYIFNSAYQSLFAFLQIVFGLAVAEQQYNFEHRDLHIGNILVKRIAVSQRISFKLDGDIFTIPSHGVKVTIIDFTLSRITHYNKSVYNDLAEDTELFTSDGDYQFEIYRLMQKETNDQWALYKPKTNIYWLHYVLDKMLETVHYKRTTTAVHNSGLKHLQKLKNSILLYDSAKTFAKSDLVSDLIA
ncbi:myb-like protein D [Sipha flava]|nr:myb-like protein D [Sipha flava]